MTADDVALITHEIAMPLDDIDPTTLHSNFAELRGGGTRAHRALDIMSPRGTAIHSAVSGRVLKLFTSRTELKVVGNDLCRGRTCLKLLLCKVNS